MSLTETSPQPGTVEQAILHWIDHEPNLNHNKATDGGYEGWVQLALRSYFEELAAPGTVIEREQHIYLNGNQKVDLLLKANDGSRTGIELKCRTKGETRQNFQRRVLQDIEKVWGGAKQEYRPIKNYVMALTDSPGDLDQWDGIMGDWPATPTHFLKAHGLNKWFVAIWAVDITPTGEKVVFR
ncbi:hypothetical protein M0657_011213 [Pyricularia oryzae]|uniref:Uncharacterized protein n=1 Tax=Pyricularia oryzae (strain Y34) TaxID=1143189 RepID=A0AA97PMA0_PYRO3|nr:hypothetical protein OOU_Y34scaffold00479g1 [Pyricularia oryzae Y34]KAI7908617.1 hypothetical protein M9X92_012092 [Pyricularia oryzae]KAI7910848.1 hypothetical protein M0657_011213 [Pyricularia oryzae]